MTRSIRLRDYDGAERAYLEAMLADPCAYCREPSTHLDHLDAQARGGDDGWENLAGVCGRCNPRKRTKSVLGFLGSLQLRPLFLEVSQSMRDWDAL